MSNVHQKNTWLFMKWAVFTTKKRMTSMKWAMFTKKTHDFSWNEQCSQKKHMAFHEIINIYQKTTHDLPWNEPCSQKNTLPFMKCTMSTKKKTHYFSWICMKWPAKHWAISRAPGTRTNAISSAVEMGWWAVSFVGFDPMNIWRFLWNIRRYDIIIICI